MQLFSSITSKAISRPTRNRRAFANTSRAEFSILIMWSFGNPKSSTAVIIIAILLFAEMNAIASLKLQSFNNNRARRNPLTADTKCCPGIVGRRTKRFIRLDLRSGLNGALFSTTFLALALTSIFGAVGAGLGFGAALFAANIGSVWKEKTGTSSSQTIQLGSANPVLPMGVAHTTQSVEILDNIIIISLRLTTIIIIIIIMAELRIVV